MPIAASAVLLAGCGGSAGGDTSAGPGMTDLAPTFSAEEDTAAETDDATASEPRDRGRSERPRQGSSVEPDRSGPARSEPRARTTSPPGRGPARGQPGPTAAAPGPVRITDASGDLSTGLESAPASADIVAVELARVGGTVEVRTTFAAAVPRQQSGSNGMNVASFYDVDGNGIIDYEIWASLADNGWGTGHLDRRQEKASFGPGTGIEVSVEGVTLVTRFPVEQVGGADGFRWSAASEWGSYESMAASTSARDYAPDEGAVGFPG